MLRKTLPVTLFLGIYMTLLLVAVPTPVSAASADNCGGSSSSFLSFPTWYKYLTPEFKDPDGPGGPKPASCELTLPADNQGNPSPLLAAPRVLLAVFEILLRISGLVAILAVVYGGVLYVLSQGEPDRTKNAKNTIVNALIGLVIAMSSVAIVNLIGRNIV